jgi:hypothetical protein
LVESSPGNIFFVLLSRFSLEIYRIKKKASVSFGLEEPAREYRQQAYRLRGAYMTAEQMNKVTKTIRTAFFRSLPFFFNMPRAF